MLYSGTDPESCITEYTLVYEDKRAEIHSGGVKAHFCQVVIRCGPVRLLAATSLEDYVTNAACD